MRLPQKESFLNGAMGSIEQMYDTVAQLPALERKIVTLRYFYARTQQQTADFLGMTQVQVSRKEKKILQTLRLRFGEE